MSTSQKIALASGKILAKHGVPGVTMRRVAAELGITPMALYRHYANRETLLTALADQGFEDLAARLDALRLKGSLERRFLAILDSFLDFAFEHPRLFELMFFSKREGARQFPADFRAGLSPTANSTVQVIKRAMDSGLLRKDDAWEVAFGTGALLQGLVMLYLGGRVSLTPPQFRALCHRSFSRYLHGIRN